MKRTGTVFVHTTGIHVWEDHEHPAMFQVFCQLLKRLRERGYRLQEDPAVRNLRILKKTHRLAVRADDLNATVQLSGRHLEVEFFSERQSVNKCGGRYDFQKLDKMTRLNQLKVIVEVMGLLRMLVGFGYEFRASARDTEAAGLDYLLLRDVMRDERRRRMSPLGRFNHGWEKSRFKRDKTGWPQESEYAGVWPSKDRDGKPLRNGQTRYLRVRGRVMFGNVYTNMNDMWQFAYGGREVTWVHATELFMCDDPSSLPRRVVPKQFERLETELARAVKSKAFHRVVAIGGELSRMKVAA